LASGVYLGMDIYQFIELSTEEQVSNVWRGTFIANRNYKGFNVVLYSIDNFFVEVFYNQTENAITQIRPFRSQTRLMPYINSIDLTQLICG
jgi:hypothetical protein